MELFADILLRSLAIPDSACAPLHGQAYIHGAIEAQSGTQVAADQVGDHAENFVEQE